MKLTGYPLPKHALILLIAGVGALKIAEAVGRGFPRFRLTIQFVLVLGAAVCAALVPQSFIDNSIFWFPPALFLYAAWLYYRASRQPSRAFERRAAAGVSSGAALVLGSIIL